MRENLRRDHMNSCVLDNGIVFKTTKDAFCDQPPVSTILDFIARYSDIAIDVAVSADEARARLSPVRVTEKLVASSHR